MNKPYTFVKIDYRKIDKKEMQKTNESLEDFLSRGGEIKKVTVKDALIDRALGANVSGVNVGTSKLTEDQVREIRSSKLTQRELVKIYKVNISTICKIKARLSWCHIK